MLLHGKGLKSDQADGCYWSQRIVIPTGAQRSGGTCCFSAGSHADTESQSTPTKRLFRHACGSDSSVEGFREIKNDFGDRLLADRSINHGVVNA
jgi:hypothetical protein